MVSQQEPNDKRQTSAGARPVNCGMRWTYRRIMFWVFTLAYVIAALMVVAYLQQPPQNGG